MQMLWRNCLNTNLDYYLKINKNFWKADWILVKLLVSYCTVIYNVPILWTVF